MSHSLDDSLRWTEDGTALIERALQEADLAEPSLLPGWSRAAVLAHVGLNARAIGNLVTWAKTGIETPMYVSREQRDADIAVAATLPDEEIVTRFRTSATELREAMAGLIEDQWAAQVRTSRGGVIVATEIPWLRSREVMIHAVDLDASVDWPDLPLDFLAELISDVTAQRSEAGQGPYIDLRAVDSDHVWTINGVGPVVHVIGPTAQLAAYLVGRPFHDVATDGEGKAPPALPPWI